MEKRKVETAGAPKAIGPYSQAIRWGDLVLCSGQIPLDPSTGRMVGEDAVGQFRRCVENLRAVLEDAGSSLAGCLQVTLYLADMGDFAAVNEAYAELFPAPHPARVTIQAAALPKGARVELAAVAGVH